MAGHLGTDFDDKVIVKLRRVNCQRVERIEIGTVIIEVVGNPDNRVVAVA